jgi:hypothetical protein
MYPQNISRACAASIPNDEKSYNVPESVGNSHLPVSLCCTLVMTLTAFWLIASPCVPCRSGSSPCIAAAANCTLPYRGCRLAGIEGTSECMSSAKRRNPREIRCCDSLLLLSFSGWHRPLGDCFAVAFFFLRRAHKLKTDVLARHNKNGGCLANGPRAAARFST